MTNRGVTKLIICLAVFALSLSMFFQSWFSFNKSEWMGVANNIFTSGKNMMPNILGTGEEVSQKTTSNIIVDLVEKLFSKRVDSILNGIANVFNFSPQMVTQLSKFISFITEGASDVLNKTLLINVTPVFFQKTAMLFSIWEYAIYIAAGIALASIIIDRTIGILPYVLLLCTYPMVVFWRLQTLVTFIKITLTPYAIVSIATAIILLILSIAIRDKKRYALRREAKKMKRWMYL